MTRLLLGIAMFVTTLGISQEPPEEFHGTIQGRVLRKSTSEALPQVLITMIRSGGANSSAISPQVLADLAAQIESIRRTAGPLGRGSPEVIEARVSEALKKAGITAASPFTITDASGSFTFKDLPEGTYVIRAARDGYFGPPVNGISPTGAVKTVELKSGRAVADLEILLIQASVIRGKIFPPSGYVPGAGNPANPLVAPMRLSPVGIYRSTYDDGRETWELTATGIVNRDGDFRIANNAPGEVYVGAPAVQRATPPRFVVPPTRASTPVSGVPTSSMSNFDLKPTPAPQPLTLFPGVKDPSLARKIELEEGENKPLELHLLPPEGGSQVYTIKGSTGLDYNCVQVGGALRKRVPELFLIPQVPGVLDALQSVYPNYASAEGDFEIRLVPEGSYELIAPCTDPATGRALVGRSRLDVGRGSSIGVSAPIKPGASLFGEFLVTGPNGEAVRSDLLDLRLKSLGKIPDSLIGEPNPFLIDRAGKFVAANLPEDRYTFRVGKLPEDAYIEEIRQLDTITGADRSVFDDGFELGPNSPPVKIVIHTQGGIVYGEVRKPDGRIAEDATVVLVPPEEKRRNAQRYVVTTSNAEGKFYMHGVPPGQYTVLTWENIAQTAWMNPDIFERHKSKGLKIEVSRGVPVELQLAVIPAETKE